MHKHKINFCFVLLILMQTFFCFRAEGADNKSELVQDLKGQINRIIQRNEEIFSEFSYKKRELDNLINKRDALIEEQMRLHAQNEEADREIEDLKVIIKELTRSIVQEKEMAKLLLKDRPFLRAKLKKIEMRWDYATRLYNQQKYEEAIKVFEEIIKLEGEKKNEKHK